MSQCTCFHGIGYQPLTPWMDKISSAQMEQIRKNFPSVKPMNDTPLALPKDTSVAAPSKPSPVVIEYGPVRPVHTGYARIDNAITDALRGKSQELKDSVYDIIRSDFLPNNVHGVEETDRLVLGVRDLTLPQVPARSKAGNRLSSWAFHTLYGVRLGDTQTGLRGIPWELLSWCGEIRGERFEYEMNMLIRAARERRELREVTIQVIYFDNNRGTHLRAVRDSWRVFLVLASGLGWYAVSSVLSAVTDVLAFWLCSAVVFRSLTPLYCYWWSTLTARALSSSLNYTLNRRYVFGARPRGRTLLRYYILWGSQLLCSYLLLLVMNWLLPGIWPTANKALGDIILAICSYQIQMHWVFREEGPHGAG